MDLRTEWKALKKKYPEIEKDVNGKNLGPALDDYEEYMKKGDEVVAAIKKLVEAAQAHYMKAHKYGVASMGAMSLYYQKGAKPLKQVNPALEKDVANFMRKVNNLESAALAKKNGLPKL